MTKKEAIAKGLCPICKDYDPGYIRCNARNGNRCRLCEQYVRDGIQDYYGQGLPFDHICDDCCGLGTYKAYLKFCGKYTDEQIQGQLSAELEKAHRVLDTEVRSLGGGQMSLNNPEHQ